MQGDRELFSVMKEKLYTAVVGDVMDKLGLRHQFLPAQIKPLRDDMKIAGRAMPVLEADCFEETMDCPSNPVMGRPFGLMLEALDNLKENEVYVCTGASPAYALWGELMSLRAGKLKAAGAIVDGFSRDTDGILRQNFPVFSSGTFAQDQGPRGKVIAYRVPIELGGVSIRPGDILFGDRDGVCVIPQEAEKEVLQAAFEKASGEKLVAAAILEGMSTQDAFAKYGIM